MPRIQVFEVLVECGAGALQAVEIPREPNELGRQALRVVEVRAEVVEMAASPHIDKLAFLEQHETVGAGDVQWV